jgi:hypothetical protein
MINIFNKKPQDFKFLEAFELLEALEAYFILSIILFNG